MNKEALKNLSTLDLDAMLNTELREEVPNRDLVRSILHVLEEREKDQPVEITPEIQAVWDKFNAKDQRRADRPRPTARSWVAIRAASIAAVLCLILVPVIPQTAKAESLWERLTRWTAEVLEVLTAHDAKFDHSEYVFKTDNEGLQQVYDAVVELGVKEHIVPMWIPDGYELYEMGTESFADKIRFGANFTNGEDNLVFQLNIWGKATWHEYHKSEEDVSVYEYANVKHNIMQNNGRWIVFWETEKIECVISVGVEEADMYKIVQSIY